MWNYTKCTEKDREEKLRQLTEAFRQETDCLKYLAEVQTYIHNTHTTIVLLQDLEANILIEMDYVPIYNYNFHVVSIDENGIKNQGLQCTSIEQAVSQFSKKLGASC